MLAVQSFLVRVSVAEPVRQYKKKAAARLRLWDNLIFESPLDENDMLVKLFLAHGCSLHEPFRKATGHFSKNAAQFSLTEYVLISPVGRWIVKCSLSINC